MTDTYDTPQLKVWKSQFGRDWADRNKSLNALARSVAFQRILDSLKEPARNILEVGCGPGANLMALRQVGYMPKELAGMDPMNFGTLEFADFKVGDCFNVPYPDASFDMVFTSGVLMHVEAKDLSRASTELSRVARKYVMLIEYYSFEEEMISWRGHDNLLFKRNYRNFLPNLLQIGFLGKEDGWDDCNVWIFGKEK